MSRIWFATELETAAMFWRILRSDGVTLGFTTHDRDLWFDGVLHRASPGMVPSSIRRSADVEPDEAEVSGALTHESISSEDLSAGRFDHARVHIGIVDWDAGGSTVLYAGSIGTISQEDGTFTADLTSRKVELHRDPVPRTSPYCRAEFCGPGCNLNPAAYSHEVRVAAFDPLKNAVSFTPPVSTALLAGGTTRWLDGPQAGASAGIVGDDGAGGVILDFPIDVEVVPGTALMVREGCDRTLATCADRFGNAANFRGEPYLPGNDMLTRYPEPTA